MHSTCEFQNLSNIPWEAEFDLMCLMFQIEHYPKIREDVESRIISHVYANAPEQEKNVLALLEMETAFQNTNHEEFKANEYV